MKRRTIMIEHVEYPIALIGIAGRKDSGKDTVAQMIQYLIARRGDDSDIYIQTAEFLGLTDNNWEAINNSQPFKIKRFADKVKDMTCILLGCNRKQLEDRDYKETALGEESNYWIIDYDDFEFYGQEKFQTLEEALEKRKELLLSYTNVSEPVLIKLTPKLVMQLLGTEGVRNNIHFNAWVISTFDNFNKYTDHWIIPDVRFPNELEAIKKRGGLTIGITRTAIDSKEVVDYHSSETSLDEAVFDYVIDNSYDIEELLKQVKKILQEEGLLP